ncbi:Phospholipid methyltransferase [Candidatus Hepatincola sp. Av]
MKQFLAYHRLPISRVLIILCFLVFVFIKPILVDSIFYIFMLIIGLILVLVGILGRVFANIFLSDNRNKKLVSSGIYSISRNPLYFFSFLGTLGILFIYGSFLVMFIVITFYAIYYWQVIQFEEKSLTAKLGKEYSSYLNSGVPRFFPNFSRWQSEKYLTVNYNIVKKSILDSFYFFLIAILIIIILNLQAMGLLPVLLVVW